MADDQPDAVPDITAALPDLLPEISRTTRLGWGLIVADAVVAVLLARALWHVGDDAPGLGIGALLFGAILLPVIAGYVRRLHENQIMPMLARTAQLSFSPSGKSFLDTLPPRLMPKGAVKRSEDLIQGSIGGRQVRFAEMNYETGGKGSRTLFRGIVMAFPNLAPMPAFFLAPDGETTGSFWTGGAKIKVDDLIRLRSKQGSNGIAYGIWGSSTDVAQNPALEQVIEVLTHLEHAVGSGAKLYSATSNGEIIHIALNHRRDLFRMGGLFSTEESLIHDIRMAYQDLTLPMVIAGKLLEAEKNALPAAKISAAPV